MANITTIEPADTPVEASIHVVTLQRLHVTDRAIHDTTNLVAYSNYVNRIVLGLGIDLEEDGGAGFNY